MDIINDVKKQIAKENGFKNECGTLSAWEFAMVGLERTKKGIAMYESALALLKLTYNNALMKETGDNIERVSDEVEAQFHHLVK